MSEHRLRLAWAGLHPDRTRRLLAEWGSARAVVRAIERRQIKVSPAAAAAVAVPASDRRAELQRLGVRFETRDDAAFPVTLGELPDAPDAWFARGTVPPGPTIAVVGTRRCSSYGRGLARAFGAAIAAGGWVLVSGLARGIDGQAHLGTVDGGGRGVAVLGCGLDVCYPPEHRSLAERLLELGGAVVSEYPPGTRPEGWRFPPRNRIISGLADVVVVVEAARTGGALITASAALDQGRAVFAVPGDVDREASVGCNLLIRDGALPVLGADDLVEALSLVVGPPAIAASAEAGDDELVTLARAPGRSLDELSARMGLPAADLLARVARLEAAGRVAREGVVVVAS